MVGPRRPQWGGRTYLQNGSNPARKLKRPASDIGSLPNRYVLADEVLGIIPSIPQSEAQRDLVRWYLENYSPATREDVSWWTGLTLVNREDCSFPVYRLGTNLG
jgi:hypothetical protein